MLQNVRKSRPCENQIGRVHEKKNHPEIKQRVSKPREIPALNCTFLRKSRVETLDFSAYSRLGPIVRTKVKSRPAKVESRPKSRVFQLVSLKKKYNLSLGRQYAQGVALMRLILKNVDRSQTKYTEKFAVKTPTKPGLDLLVWVGFCLRSTDGKPHNGAYLGFPLQSFARNLLAPMCPCYRCRATISLKFCITFPSYWRCL
jgi:hypothetical protein